MVLDLRKIFLNDGSSMPVSATFDFSDVEFFGGYPLKQPLEMTGKIENRAGVVSIACDCNGAYTAPCDRCAVECTVPFSIPFVQTLVCEREQEDDEDLLLLKDYKLDLQDLCYNEVIPNLPTKHLCKASCKGVCPICGKNLNDGACACATKTTDPRLASLGDLLK